MDGRSGRARAAGAWGRIMYLLLELLRGDEAATAVEYAVILALILMAVVGAIGGLGTQTGGLWHGINGRLEDVGFVP